MSIIWRKVARDLWRDKFRTLLVVISTAVGVFAIGLVFGLSGILRTRMTEDYQASLPAHVTIWWASPFDEAAVEAIRRLPGVDDAEGETVSTFRWKLEGDTEWRDRAGMVTARGNYEAQRINLCDLLDGMWPSSSGTHHTLAMEQQTARHFGIPLGATAIVELGRSERRVTVAGIVRDPNSQPPVLGGNAAFYATQETFAWLTNEGDDFRRLQVRLDTYTEEIANEAGERITDRLERMGLSVSGYGVSDPAVHPAQETMDSLLLILTVMGSLSLALSGFLIVNTMNALVTQQVWQIGVMKVVGATAGRVVRLYLSTALVYGGLALVLAVPVAAIAACAAAMWLLDLVHIAIGPFRLVPHALGIQVAVALAVPQLAALVPVIGAARITVHQAVRSYGLGSGFGRGGIDRLVGSIRRLPRPLMLSLRNTFRRKARIALTLVTLVLGGVMFIVVMSVGASLDRTLEVVLSDFGFDALIVFDQSYHVGRLIEATESVPGVTDGEAWDRWPVQISLGEDEEREAFVWSVPPDSEMFSPRIIAGRGLLPDDGHTILLNSKIAADEGLEVGDEIELTIGEKQSTWRIVGILVNVNNLQRDSFVPFDALARETGGINRGSVVMVKYDDEGAPENELIGELRAAFDSRRMEVAFLQTAQEVRQLNEAVFDVVVYLMLAMAVLAAIVGSVGLASTMSINVVERAREIGVMRAIGAASATVLGIFVVEGMLVGVLSWLLALPFSYPGARVFSSAVGQSLMNIPLDFRFSAVGALGWLLVVVTLSALASLWPALRATQVSVREALAYE